MKFLNKKEQVIDLEITPYGKSLLARGKFRPAFYAFYDRDVVYDSEYGGVIEVQNYNIQIKKEQLNTEWMLKQQTSDKGGMLKLRNAITKSYKYIGLAGIDNTDIITFNADIWKDVAQNQIQMF